MDTNTTNGSVTLPGVGALLKDSVDIYKKLWDRLIEIAVPTALLLVGYFVALVLARYSTILGVIGFLLLVATLIFYINFLASFTLLLAKPERTESAKEIRDIGWKYFWPWIWVLILMRLVALPGMFLLVVPGVIISIRLMFAQFVLLTEDKRGLAALGRSWYLMMGNGWRVLWRIFVMVFCVGIAWFVASFIIGLVGGFIGAFVGKWITDVVVIALLLSLYFCFIPYCFIFSYRLYEIISGARGSNETEEAKYAKRAKIWAWFSPIGIIIVTMLSIISLLYLNTARIKYIQYLQSHSTSSMPTDFSSSSDETTTSTPY